MNQRFIDDILEELSNLISIIGGIQATDFYFLNLPLNREQIDRSIFFKRIFTQYEEFGNFQNKKKHQ